MDNSEARQLLLDHLDRYRKRSYADLVSLLKKPENTELAGVSGTKYQVQVQAFWDREPKGNLRVQGAIDDGGLRAFKPLVEDFIRAPSGAFIGE
jgi:hypothetical protein